MAIRKTRIDAHSQPAQHLLQSYYEPLFEMQDRIGDRIKSPLSNAIVLNDRPPMKIVGEAFEILPTKSAKKRVLWNSRDPPNVELWTLMKEFRWEGLIMLLKVLYKIIHTLYTTFISIHLTHIYL